MRCRILLTVALAMIAVGCGKKKPADPANGGGGSTADDPTAQNDLKTIGLGFLNYCDATKGNPFASSMPANAGALEKFMGDNPTLLTSGKYKIFWSAPATQTIIACEKDAETTGGWVCMRMGDAQKMTAAEVQSAVAKK